MPRASVLVVDDEPLIRWCLAESLRALHLEVDEAADAASALRAVSTATAPYDVVLLDIRLPDADGLGLLGLLRRGLPHADIIVMSAHAPASLLARALSLGAFSVLAKPFPLEHVEREVTRALAGEAALPLPN